MHDGHFLDLTDFRWSVRDLGLLLTARLMMEGPVYVEGVRASGPGPTVIAWLGIQNLLLMPPTFRPRTEA